MDDLADRLAAQQEATSTLEDAIVTYLAAGGAGGRSMSAARGSRFACASVPVSGPASAGARPVILSDAARKILRGQLEGHAGDVVFPRPDGRPYSREQIGKMFRRASRGGGLKDFHFHDLRHHGATMALNKGFTAPIVMALGGWKAERMMRRYAAVTHATLRAAAEAVSGTEVHLAANASPIVPSNPK